MSQSFIHSSFLNLSKKYQSYIINILIKRIRRIKIKTTILTFLPWQSIILFLFVISLALAPDSQIQLSTLSSTGTDFSQRQFGIVIFSLSNLLLIPLSAIFISKFRKDIFSFFGFEIILLFYLLIAQVSAIFGLSIQPSFIWLLKLLFSFIIYFIFSRIRLTQKLVNIILLACATTILLEGLLVSAQFIKGDLVGFPIESAGRYKTAVEDVANPAQPGYFRVVGTFSHPNNLSSYVALLLPIMIILGFYTNKFYIRFASYALIVIGTIISILTYSRWGIVTSLFACFITIIFLTLLTKLQPLKTLYSFRSLPIVLLLVFVMSFFINQSITKRFLQFSLSDGSLITRINLMVESLYTIYDNPLLGTGGGNSLTYFANYDYTDSMVSERFLAQVHNFFLLFATEVGIPALLVFLISMAGVVKFFFDQIKYLTGKNKYVCVGLFASFVTFFLNGLWGMRSFEDRIGFLFFLLLGLLINLLSSPITHLS